MARPQAIMTLLADDPRIRMTRWDFDPGAETGWHRHELDYVVVPMTECPFLVEEKDGGRLVEVAAGAAYRGRTGVEHNVVNGGAAPMAFIEIELKD